MKQWIETRLNWQVRLFPLEVSYFRLFPLEVSYFRLFPLEVSYFTTPQWHEGPSEKCSGYRLKILNRRGEDKGGVTFYSIEELEQFGRLVQQTIEEAHATA
jgi:hypothetical protein